jgi:hypothetical protein
LGLRPESRALRAFPLQERPPQVAQPGQALSVPESRELQVSESVSPREAQALASPQWEVPQAEPVATLLPSAA